ncbi:SorB family sulfite dehydrogenase c-type cytochrome subunit [Sphingobium sp. EP60837]|uniref:SorB family sulfite dehydrogenase c-type cytochrome subunit n=1 Tax=Sphingobium sp. EP60837 TaxID=1855519 RepID=UPI0007DD1C97|nr:cytochrome C [Sphingobium sp. EP60837]ANI79914.1 Sulfite dehydrogenase [Sphingobium sp. EP60837]
MSPKPYLLALGLIALAATATARTRDYELPADTVPFALAGAKGEIIVNNCMGCHSLDYITTQPRGKGPQFWRDAVNKMVTVYGAPIDPADVDALTAALQQTHG